MLGIGGRRGYLIGWNTAAFKCLVVTLVTVDAETGLPTLDQVTILLPLLLMTTAVDVGGVQFCCLLLLLLLLLLPLLLTTSFPDLFCGGGNTKQCLCVEVSTSPCLPEEGLGQTVVSISKERRIAMLSCFHNGRREQDLRRPQRLARAGFLYRTARCRPTVRLNRRCLGATCLNPHAQCDGRNQAATALMFVVVLLLFFCLFLQLHCVLFCVVLSFG